MVDADNIKREGEQFIVFKQTFEKQIIFGEFDSLETAIRHRDYYRRYDWDPKLKKVYNPENLDGEEYLHNVKGKPPKEEGLEYIQKLFDGSYRITKLVNGKVHYFGRYSNLELAKKARDYFVGTGWNLDDRLLFRDMNDSTDFKKDYWDNKELF